MVSSSLCTEKTTKENEREEIYGLAFLCSSMCTANGALLRAIYNEMFRALEKLNKRHFYSQVQSSLSVSGALVFIDTIQWNQHAQLKWWVVKKSTHLDKSDDGVTVMWGQWLSNWTITNEYNAIQHGPQWTNTICWCQSIFYGFASY